MLLKPVSVPEKHPLSPFGIKIRQKVPVFYASYNPKALPMALLFDCALSA